jgi:hypothetical protein
MGLITGLIFISMLTIILGMAVLWLRRICNTKRGSQIWDLKYNLVKT